MFACCFSRLGMQRRDALRKSGNVSTNEAFPIEGLIWAVLLDWVGLQSCGAAR